MQTLNIQEAATFLKCSEDTVGELAHAGEIPAAKVGRSWVFVDEDLIGYIRSLYGKDRKCHSTKEARFGGRMSVLADNELDDLLAHKTGRKQKPSMTSLKLISASEKTKATP
jgi:excisionase family DNA binding protein